MGENFLVSSSLKEALYIRTKILKVDAPELVETSIYIDVLMEKSIKDKKKTTTDINKKNCTNITEPWINIH